jgi:iron uptake system component EfeO
MSRRNQIISATGTAVIVGMALAGCSSNSTTASEHAGVIAVTSSDDACQVSATEAPSGTVSFAVQNTGSQVTEFYLMAEDGQAIIGEVENVGPGLTRDLVVQVQPGSYLTACKPGMAGDGIRAPFTVTDSGNNASPSGAAADRVTAATTSYAGYVREEAEELESKTDEFVAAYLAGDDDRARAQYATARAHWERIEPVAESFGDLDPKLDLREADL